MAHADPIAQQFEQHRPYLRGVAYRMLGSFDDADDAVQDAWLRASGAGLDGIDNVRAWLTTIVSRVCLNMLRSRRTRREESLDLHLPDPVIGPLEDDPEAQAVLADSVSFALFLVLETLSPDERLAFVLHDMFGLRFDEIAPIVDRTPEATRKLASRARIRVRAGAPRPNASRTDRAVVEVFIRAARTGDLDGLMRVLHPDVVIRNDVHSDLPMVVGHGAETVSHGARAFARQARRAYWASVNGTLGGIAIVGDRIASVAAFTVVDGQIVAIDILSDRRRMARIDPRILETLTPIQQT